MTSIFPGGYLFDIFDQVECQSLIESASKINLWKTAAITRYENQNDGKFSLISQIDKSKRDCERIHLADLNYSRNEIFFECIDRIKNKIFPILINDYNMDFSIISETEIVRYGVGGIFIPHVDSNKLKPYRAFTVILYLNDDFDGGQTSFPEINYSVEPSVGRVLIFPSHMLHGGESVTRGEKHIIVAWVFYPD